MLEKFANTTCMMCTLQTAVAQLWLGSSPPFSGHNGMTKLELVW